MDTPACLNLWEIYIWNVQNHDKAQNVLLYSLSLQCLYDNVLASILIPYIDNLHRQKYLEFYFC